MRILITGKNGYVGRSLHSYLYSKHDITIIGRQDLDLTNPNETSKFFSDKYFDLVIHTAVIGGNRLSPDGPDVALSNLLMYDNLMRCRAKFDRLIHFGSGAEDLANTPYGFSKHIINQLMKLDLKPTSTNWLFLLLVFAGSTKQQHHCLLLNTSHAVDGMLLFRWLLPGNSVELCRLLVVFEY